MGRWWIASVTVCNRLPVGKSSQINKDLQSLWRKQLTDERVGKLQCVPQCPQAFFVPWPLNDVSFDEDFDSIRYSFPYCCFYWLWRLLDLDASLVFLPPQKFSHLLCYYRLQEIKHYKLGVTSSGVNFTFNFITVLLIYSDLKLADWQIWIFL